MDLWDNIWARKEGRRKGKRIVASNPTPNLTVGGKILRHVDLGINCHDQDDGKRVRCELVAWLVSFCSVGIEVDLRP